VELMLVCLGGDVMTGRGVDQVLPHPSNPRLREGQVRDARSYVSLAEAKSGPIPWPVPFSWPWGDALRAVEKFAPAVRVVNLETSITTSDAAAADKEVHYRMNPANLGCLAAFQPDICVLANNHLLDFGAVGLRDTLDALESVGVRAAGAGVNGKEARRPVIVPTAEGGRIVLLAMGAASSGIPASWAARADAPGVAFLPRLSNAAADDISDRVCRIKQPGDIVVVSLHWGSNWGYRVTPGQVSFAHRLVDHGVDVVYGHSSHHPRPIEVYRGKLILYGCGDLIDDYEGIGGYEEFRDDLRLLYFASLEPATGRLTRLTMTPLQSRQIRLQRASLADAHWLCGVIQDASRPFATWVAMDGDGSLIVRTATR
jgi:poly-gamma-glutamate synthesis protein (capsule biosynthesis protein)